MRQFTNLAWPDDPYGTGQQLYRKHPPLLAAFAAMWGDDGDRAVPIAYAVAYLRLHRTQTVMLEPDGFEFGFRAAAAETPADVADLTGLFDLDLLQARRHATILAAYSFLDDLYCMGKAAPVVHRGVTGMLEAWPRRDERQRGMAHMVDVAGSKPATVENLCQLCVRLDIATGSAPRGLASPVMVAKRWTALTEPGSVQWLAAAATEKALVIALAAGRTEYRCTWQGLADIGSALSRQAWDDFPAAQEATI